MGITLSDPLSARTPYSAHATADTVATSDDRLAVLVATVRVAGILKSPASNAKAFCAIAMATE